MASSKTIIIQQSLYPSSNSFIWIPNFYLKQYNLTSTLLIIKCVSNLCPKLILFPTETQEDSCSPRLFSPWPCVTHFLCSQNLAALTLVFCNLHAVYLTFGSTFEIQSHPVYILSFPQLPLLSQPPLFLIWATVTVSKLVIMLYHWLSYVFPCQQPWAVVLLFCFAFFVLFCSSHSSEGTAFGISWINC